MNASGGIKTKMLWALLAAAVLTVGILYLLQLSGRQISLGVQQAVPSSVKLKAFQGKNPPFDFSFEYPEKWEEKTLSLEGQYDMVQILGPRDETTGSSPAIFVTIQTLKETDSPAALMEALLEKEKRFNEFKVLQKKETKIGGYAGQQAQYEFSLPLPLYAKESKMTTLKREQAFIVKNGKSYQVSFFATEEQFKIFKPIFDRVLETFKFLS